MSAHTLESARREARSLAGSGLPLDTFVPALIDALERAVPFDSACFATTDPATGLFTGAVKKHIDEAERLNYAFSLHEYSTADVNQFIDLATRPSGVGVLHEDTGGDPHRSERYLAMLRPHLDAEHELRAVARRGGAMWGAYALYRAAGSRPFTSDEAGFLQSIEQIVTTGIRSGLVTQAARTAAATSTPAVLTVDGAGRVAQASPTAEALLLELGGSLERLPVAVASVLGAVTSAAPPGAAPAAGRLRVRAASGCWYLLHAAPFHPVDATGAGTGARGHVVTIDEATSPAIVPLLIAAYGLTAREADIVRGILRGDSTKAIASSLHLSAYTVQDHVKAIFDKTGVSSRRELVAQVFFAHQVEHFGAAPRVTGANLPAT